MKVGLMGFGRTGRAVSSVLLNSEGTCLQWVMRRSSVLQHRSVAEFLGIASDDPGLIYSTAEFSVGELLDRHPVDVIVDFSSEEGLDYYADEAAKRGIAVVSAISYYPDRQLQRLRRIAVKTRVLHSPNITLGVNFLIIAAKILQNIAPEADIEIVEEHFSSKLEVSGTAKIIARELSKPESAIKTIRAGGIVGVHEILFGFPHQTVRLKHESIAREAFGNGVLFGIDNLAGKPNGFYTMGELLIPYFKLRDTDADKERISPWWQFWAKRDNRTEPRVLAG